MKSLTIGSTEKVTVSDIAWRLPVSGTRKSSYKPYYNDKYPDKVFWGIKKNLSALFEVFNINAVPLTHRKHTMKRGHMHVVVRQHSAGWKVCARINKRSFTYISDSEKCTREIINDLLNNSDIDLGLERISIADGQYYNNYDIKGQEAYYVREGTIYKIYTSLRDKSLSITSSYTAHSKREAEQRLNDWAAKARRSENGA